MVTKTGNIKVNTPSGKANFAPNTITTQVADPARRQALSASLGALTEKNVLGYPTFSTLEAYTAGTTVFYDRRLYTFTADHAAGAWNAEEVEGANVRTLVTDAIIASLLNGDTVPAAAGNLASWLNSQARIDDLQTDTVFFAGGNASIDSAKQAELVSVVAKTDFGATQLRSTGFNQLRAATQVGTGWAFLVPAMPYGTFATATQPNGVLFTSDAHENLQPTVRFLPLSSGTPTAITDGTAVTPVVENGYAFYTTAQMGWLIVSGIDRSTTCAHIAWSGRYDEYVSVDDEADAGSTLPVGAAIAACHDYGLLLNVGGLSDRVERIGQAQIRWTRVNERTKPEWTNTLQDDEETYLHTATIAAMKADGAAEFMTEAQVLIVEGTTISYTDQNEEALTDYVKFNLATQATGELNLTSAFTVEDFGLIVVEGAIGEAFVTISYAQGIPDSVRAMLASIDNATVPVIAEALTRLYNEFVGLRARLETGYGAALSAQVVDTLEYRTYGAPLYVQGAGAPSAAVVPDNWPDDKPWTGAPLYPHMHYFDKAGKRWYDGPLEPSSSIGDWVAR